MEPYEDADDHDAISAPNASDDEDDDDISELAFRSDMSGADIYPEGDLIPDDEHSASISVVSNASSVSIVNTRLLYKLQSLTLSDHPRFILQEKNITAWTKVMIGNEGLQDVGIKRKVFY